MKHEDFEIGDVVPNSKLKPGKFYFVDREWLCLLDKLEYRDHRIHCTFITERGLEMTISGSGFAYEAIQKETAPQARETLDGMYIEYESFEAKYDHMINRSTD